MKNQYEQKSKVKFTKASNGAKYYYVYDTEGNDDKFQVFGNLSDAKTYAKDKANQNNNSVYQIKEEKYVGDYRK